MKKIIGLLLCGLAGLLLTTGAFALCTSNASKDWKDPIWTATAPDTTASCNGGAGPAAGSSVVIANGTTVKVDTNPPTVANITINAGGTLLGKSGNTLSLTGNFTNNGTFTAPPGSTVAFTGTNQTITGNVTFANLTVGAGTILTLAGNITVTGTTNLTAASLASTCPANYTITNGAGAVIGQSCTTPPPLAEYRMDEAAWSGVAGQVTDSSANANNAQSFNSASTASTTPAIAGNPGTCGYGVFDNGGAITKGYVQTPLPDLTADFTVTAWIRTTNNTIPAQRILVDDQNNSGGYGISLADGAAGKIRFYSRGITPVILDSTYTIANNTWYFVAAVADITNKKRTLYVYDAAGVLLNTTTEAAWTAGAWGVDGGPVSIGAETNASAESPANFHFKGNLDEVAVYGSVLTAAQLAAISKKTHVCQSGIDHVAISAPASDMAFTATLVTIAPHDAAHAAISNGSTLSLSTSTGLGDWTIGGGTGTLTPGAANSGLATYTFGPGETVAPLNFTYQTAGTVILSVRDAAGVDLLVNTPVGEKANTITYTRPGYVFTNGVCVHNIAFGAAGQTCIPLSWPSQIAGQLFPNIYITAVSPTGVPTRLSRTAATNVSMQYGLSCHNPVAGAGKVPTFSATANVFPACKGNGATPTAWTTAANISFPAGSPSSGPFSFNYPDVGKVELWMKKSGTTSIGSSGAFVVKPGGFVLSAIQQTAVPNLANPAAANALGAKFVKAGEAFSVTVTATTCAPASATCTVAGAVTPNYGMEITPENVILTPVNVIAGMVTPVPAIGGTFTAFASGVATGTAFTWGEAGIITLTPSVASGSYLGAGDTAGAASVNVGRFYPDHFDTAVVPTAASPMACPAGLTCPVNGVVYSGQPFSLSVTAKNAAGAVTANYNATTGFAKTATLTAWGAPGTMTPPAGAGALGVSAVTAFSAGTLTEPAEKYTFSATPTAPADIYLRATDSDSVTSLSGAVEGGVKVVSGRISIANVYGTELLPLTLRPTAQYYDATGRWVTSLTDSVTNLTFPASYPVGAGTTSATPSTGTLSGGVMSISLAPPTGGTGRATVAPTALPAYLSFSAGTATFGVYSGTNVVIFRGRHGR
ncbi:MAG: hypothetical protein PHP85_09345 [Gallionella sp.]|nr:hypothetical protein [Gallionella sp.]